MPRDQIKSLSQEALNQGPSGCHMKVSPTSEKVSADPTTPPKAPAEAAGSNHAACAEYKAGVMLRAMGRLSPAFAAVLAMDGMELMTRQRLDDNTDVVVRFPLPGAGRVQVSASTRWQRRLSPDCHTYLTSLRFNELTDAQRECLQHWVDETGAPDNAPA